MVKRKRVKLILAVLIPLVILSVLLYVYFEGSGIPCFFYKITGFYCPGCGSGRAIYALLHGRIKEAFSFNIMLFILGIPATVILVYEYFRLFISKKERPPVVVPGPAVKVVIAVLVIFWIARNIPAFAFLAP